MKNKPMCERCGKEFISKYWEGGSIEHENHVSDHNLDVAYTRGEMIEAMNLTLDNYCNVKNITTMDMLGIHKCIFIWLNKKDKCLYKKAVLFFKERNKKLERILKNCDNTAKFYLTSYWARSNKLIEVLDMYKYIKINKIQCAINRDKYIAVTENGIILLNIEED